MINSVQDILDAIKEKTLKVSKLSKETGIPDQRIYKWVKRGSNITSADSDKLKAWIKKFDKSLKEADSGNGQVPVMPVLLSVMRNQDLLLEKQKT